MGKALELYTLMPFLKFITAGGKEHCGTGAIDRSCVDRKNMQCFSCQFLRMKPIVPRLFIVTVKTLTARKSKPRNIANIALP